MPTPEILNSTLGHRAAYLELLQRFVEVESPSRDRSACNAMADTLIRTLEADGWSCQRLPGSVQGDMVRAMHPGLAAGSGPRTLVLAHYDTVWPIGTLSEMPFRVDEAEDRAYGPGTFDMKGGIAGTLLAVRVLRELGIQAAGPLTLLISADEEIGSPESRAQIEADARSHDRVLVIEGAREDGALKFGRKGTAIYHVGFKGIPAHAGNHPEKGASALLALAEFALFAHTLNDAATGSSVNPTVASAGGAVNVITEDAQLSIDCRVLTLAEAARIDSAMRGFTPSDARVKLDIQGGLNRPPMEANTANMAIFEQAAAIAAGWGLQVEGAVVGGGSDGNFTSALGVSTLDGIGACGAGAHARHEHLRIHESLERSALLAAIIAAPVAG
jgi:glutamate carboxypeptidase